MSTIQEDAQQMAAKGRSQWTVRKGRLHDREMESPLTPTTPEERLSMVWPLTVEAYAFKGLNVAESRLPRHHLCITRRAR
jgi:hypothetical protein